MIRVISAVALGSETVDGPVAMRTERLLAHLPGITTGQVAATFDELLTYPMPETPALIVAELGRLGDEVTYIVPGVGVPGDLTVAAIDPAMLSSITTGALYRDGFGDGGCIVVDALSLAIAESSAPFDRGLVPIDPAWPVVVTNWYGDGVIELASKRLHRLYPDFDPLESTSSFELLLPAQDQISTIASFPALEQIASRLRRGDGCPWDRDQTSESLFPLSVEELQELGEAIDKQDIPNIAEELGDVLFHLILQAQIGAETGTFTMDDVL